MNSILSYLRAPIQKSWHYWLYAFGIVYLTFPYLRLFEEPGAGLDPSWQIALNLLREKPGIWGRDFVFTYGPLGSYIYRLPILVPAWKQFLYDGFFFLNLIYFHATCFPKQAKYYHLLLFLCFNLFSFEMIGETTAFLWMFLGMYHGFVALHATSTWKRTISLTMSFLLLGIIFFSKANYGIIVWAFLIGLIVVMVIQKRLVWYLGILWAGLFIVALMAWAQGLDTNLLLYFKTSLHIIANYNAGMSVFPEAFEKMTALTYVVFLFQVFLSLYLVMKAPLQAWSEYFLVATALGISFVLLKYSFVRADSGHFTAYVKLMSYVGLLIVANSTLLSIRRIYLLFMPVLFALYVYLYVPLVGFTALGIWHGIKYRPYILANYFQGTRELASTGQRLPATFLQRIGKHSVDVIPFELSWVNTHGLNYAPRPTLQSYLAGDRYLDSLNEVHFASNKAPDFVIYGLEKSTLKYPWAEESFTQKALLMHYEIVDSNDSLLLFARKPNHRKLRLVFTRHARHPLGKEIYLGVLQTGYLRESIFETAYSSTGNLVNLLFQPPQLMAELKSGNVRERIRVAPNLLKKGFWSNNLILNLAQAKQFYMATLDSSNTLESIKFSEGQFFQGGFKPVILATHRYYRIE
ncbi:MAG: hypothetical protein RL567_1628 [Bacteroidota bacterium]